MARKFKMAEMKSEFSTLDDNNENGKAGTQASPLQRIDLADASSRGLRSNRSSRRLSSIVSG